jgi:hypothetical protein
MIRDGEISTFPGRCAGSPRYGRDSRGLLLRPGVRGRADPDRVGETCPDCAEPIYISPAPRARELAEKMAAHFQLEPEMDALPEVDR